MLTLGLLVLAVIQGALGQAEQRNSHTQTINHHTSQGCQQQAYEPEPCNCAVSGPHHRNSPWEQNPCQPHRHPQPTDHETTHHNPCIPCHRPNPEQWRCLSNQCHPGSSQCSGCQMVPIIENHIGHRIIKIVKHVPVLRKFSRPELVIRTRHVPVIRHRQKIYLEPYPAHDVVTDKLIRNVVHHVVHRVPVVQKCVKPFNYQTIRHVPAPSKCHGPCPGPLLQDPGQFGHQARPHFPHPHPCSPGLPYPSPCSPCIPQCPGQCDGLPHPIPDPWIPPCNQVNPCHI
ncbi:Hypothetical protein NTJ_05925 [Nesidiocoris tenuis]|uniref:Uncharacterized protein n=1 Tax=Nesidiocoris tenuis TaxID=355587 RepID=A0ABN7ALK8_9HEMI|nr:Hypothetical protein NTJ_05925 [Nesidiocoris tenuis]